MKNLVDVREVDLLIIGTDNETAEEWPWWCHVICFSRNIRVLPGPIKKSNIKLSSRAETEEFFLPELPLPLDRCRGADFLNLQSVRGWPCLSLDFFELCSKHEIEEAEKVLRQGIIVAERITGIPLGVTFLRQKNNLGVAWLPHDIYSQSKWVEILVSEWAKSDKESFPNFGDWASSPEWMTPQELQIVEEIESLREQKRNFICQLDKKIADFESQLILVSNEMNKSNRRLITAQGDDLLIEVIDVLKKIGFRVQTVDQALEGNQPKREDLRLTDPSDSHNDWEAIVEVRGYSRSSGKNNDLLRLSRFADLYLQEKGSLPDKRIYIINGQLELPPFQRQEPLSSSLEDLQVFAESNGLVIWTLDLFRALKSFPPDNYLAIKNSIMSSVGRWSWRIQGSS